MFAMEYKTLGAKILYYRRIKGLTQEKLSEMAGVSRARISDIERGKGPHNTNSLLLIAKALEVDVAELMSKE
ncbi:MAG: helix-turn-helix transcriptional regulator [Phascolarctobacterium sp.]|uniref:helix-turn-helix domain-containing protein n=1 Tax=Phascolarctobacterium sp. TaxID=2049039 RepID=UPI0026DCF944|nr:helix-turn-helix transcriptional regulator [Phascolarctobacterium sp.]MDO4921766.1 helix-turn-helix transcriptional regulator [Phascolarctobacterium sp.]